MRGVRGLGDSTRVAVALVVAGVALLLAFNFLRVLQADGYKALYDGRWIAQHGIPHVEALTFGARHRPWVDEQWLAELFSYETWRVGGYALLAVVSGMSIAGAYVILALALMRRGVSIVAAICFPALAALALVGWSFVRAQNFALPLFAIVLALCLEDSAHARPRLRLSLLVPTLVLWANVHGSVLLGAALACLYVLSRAVGSWRAGARGEARACLALAAACALAPLATPYGTHILHYYREFVGNRPMQAAATEWDPPSLTSAALFELYVPLVVVAVILIRGWRRHTLPPAVLIGFVALTAVAASRETGSIAWAAMAIVVLLADSSRAWLPTRPVSPQFVAALTATGAVLTSTLLVMLAVRSDRKYESQIAIAPLVSAARYASTHPCAGILGDNWDASALLWHYPALAGRVGFDARLEQYAPSALADFVRYEVARSPRWPGIAGGYQLLLGNATFTPVLTRRLARLPGGRVIARSSQGIATVHPGSGVCATPGGGGAVRASLGG